MKLSSMTISRARSLRERWATFVDGDRRGEARRVMLGLGGQVPGATMRCATSKDELPIRVTQVCTFTARWSR